jgi:glycosyltransferase involved in cell wall biosynthesis
VKKLLIITYNWPPCGGIGVLRCLKFVKYLRKFGWEPVVYIPEGAEYPYLDRSNLKDIPENLTVIKGKIFEPFKIFKILTGRKNANLNNIVHVREKQSVFDKLGVFVRGNFFIPDARSLWIKPSVKLLTKYVAENKIDAIFTDGPPHTNTVIGTRLSTITGIPHLADFQDPWTQVDYYKLFKITTWADKIHRHMEQESIKQSKKITIASPSWAVDLESIGAKNVDVLYYGYDEDDFAKINPKADKFFTFCHSGLLGFDRNPEGFFAAMESLNKEIPGFKKDFRLKLIGQVDFEVTNSVNKHNLSDQVIFLGTVQRDISLQEICNAWALLLPLNKANNAKGRMPGKLYEYLRAKRPVISFGPNDSDVTAIINDYKVGANFIYTDSESIKKHVKSLYLNYYVKSDFSGINAVKDIAVFSNENQTKKLAHFLNEMISV